MNTEIKELEKSQLEIKVVIDEKNFESYRSKAIKQLSQEIEIDGFRKGHVPENIVISRLGNMVILEEMAEMTINEQYPKILIDNKIDAIGRPEITITKIAANSPLEFTAKVTIMPKITLPDYKKIAKDVFSIKEEIEVLEKEVEDATEKIRKELLHALSHQDETVDKEQPMSDELVKKIGPFESLEDFNIKLKESLVTEKKSKSKEAQRLKTLEQTIEKSKIDLPDLVVESELDKMLYQFKADIEQMGAKYEDYLKHLKKSEDDIRKEWRNDAEKRAKIQFILNEISKIEKIEPKPEDVEQELSKLSEQTGREITDNMRFYIESILRNEAVLEFLEKQS